MKKQALRFVVGCGLLCLALGCVFAQTPTISVANTLSIDNGKIAPASDQVNKASEYYVDCEAASGGGDGRSPATAWRTLEEVNRHIFSPGDAIYLKREATCRGLLWPKGSGSSSFAIRLSAYGLGARPKIIADKKDEEAFKLFDQQYWEVDTIEFSGGTLFGVLVSGQSGVLHHIHLKNLLVHDVYGGEVKHKESGLVVISPGKVEQHFDDVLVEGVTAYGTDQWAGILVGGGNFGDVEEKDWNTNVVVRNSVVHDLFGDGIILFRVKNGLIDSSAAWRTGMQTTQSIGTPNAVWTWMCQDCVVSNNEAFLTDSPGVDGGAFDIDYGNTRNSVVANYGHDTQGYCIAVFAAGYVTHDSVVERNLCVDNGESPRLARYQGAIFLWTWNNGVIENLRIEGNSVYWSPPGDFPALLNRADIQGKEKIFQRNELYSSAPRMLETKNNLSFRDNHYTKCGEEKSSWTVDANTYTSFDAYRRAANQEQGSTWKSGASSHSCLSARPPDWDHADSAARPGRTSSANVGTSSGWVIVSDVPAKIDPHGFMDSPSFGHLLVLKNLFRQFRGSGLGLKIKLEIGDAQTRDTARNAIRDLDMDGVDVSVQTSGESVGPSTRLVAPDGSIAKEWHALLGPAEIGLAVRKVFGRPDYSRIGPDAK